MEQHLDQDFSISPTTEDLYWYCLSKNYSYYCDLKILEEEMVPIYMTSSNYPIHSERPLSVHCPIKYGEKAEDYFNMENTDYDAVEDYKRASKAYYGFILKWRVLPFDYCHEKRFLRRKEIIKIFNRDDIKVPNGLDEYRFYFDVPDHITQSFFFDHESIKGISNQLDNLKQRIMNESDGFKTNKKKNKNHSLEVVTRALLSFKNIFDYQFSLCEEDFRDFVEKKMVNLSIDISAKKYFDKKNSRNDIWPKNSVELYRAFKFDVQDANKFTTQRNKDFKLALKLIQNPSLILSWFE